MKSVQFFHMHRPFVQKGSAAVSYNCVLCLAEEQVDAADWVPNCHQHVNSGCQVRREREKKKHLSNSKDQQNAVDFSPLLWTARTQQLPL